MSSQLYQCKIACIYCKSSTAVVVGRKDGKSKNELLTVACSVCGLVRVDPMPSNESLLEFYRTTYRSDYKKILTPKFKHVWRAAHLARERMSYFKPWLINAKTSLDIGAGGGEFVGVSRAQGIHAVGIEPNEGYARYAKREYGLEIINAPIENFPEIGIENFDMISCFHVLEHLPDPIDSLKKMASRLAPNGHLLLEVPNILYPYAAPGNTFFQAHVYHFSPSTLKALILEAGLVCRNIQTTEDARVIRAVVQMQNSALAPRLEAVDQNQREALLVADIHGPKSWWYYFRSSKIFEKFNHRVDRVLSEAFLSLRYSSRKSMFEKVAKIESSKTVNPGRTVKWFMLGWLFCEVVT